MSDRDRVLALLKRHGWNATSFQVLEQGFEYWFWGDSACVAYVDTGRAWVVGGAPIASAEQLAEVAVAFVAHAKAASRRVVFFATEQRFAEAHGFVSILVGEQPIWDPADWAGNVRDSKSLREQLRRARAKGVTVRLLQPDEVALPEAPLRLAVERLIHRWMGAQPMPPMGFLVRVQPFLFPEEKRLFVACMGERVVGFAGVIPVYARSGWFIEDLIRAPDAPNGTVESLVDAAMRCAADTGASYLTLGLAPLSGAVEFWLGAARKYGSALYDFGGLQAFKAKFKPRKWVPIYLSHPLGESSYRAIYASLAAFARGGLFRYGLETLLRGPDIVVRVLALLLVPWTTALALASTKRWFPAPWVQWAWIAFDVGLCAALFSLTLRWRQRLADALVWLIVADALVTFAEACWFNLMRVTSALDVLLMCVAVLAPTLASIVLWNARRRAMRFKRT